MIEVIGFIVAGFGLGVAIMMYLVDNHLSLTKAEDIFRRAKSRVAAKAAYKHEMEKDTTVELR